MSTPTHEWAVAKKSSGRWEAKHLKFPELQPAKSRGTEAQAIDTAAHLNKEPCGPACLVCEHRRTAEAAHEHRKAAKGESR